MLTHAGEPGPVRGMGGDEAGEAALGLGAKDQHLAAIVHHAQHPRAPFGSQLGVGFEQAHGVDPRVELDLLRRGGCPSERDISLLQPTHRR